MAGVICDNTKITFVPENAFELTDPKDFISCDRAPKIDQENISELLQTRGNYLSLCPHKYAGTV